MTLMTCDKCGEELHDPKAVNELIFGFSLPTFSVRESVWCGRCRDNFRGWWRHAREVCPRCEGARRYNGRGCAVCGGDGTMKSAVANQPAHGWGVTAVTTRAMCSWCHRMTRLPADGTALCLSCGHEVGVARMNCGCPFCAGQRLAGVAPHWPRGTRGRVLTHHRSDDGYSSAAELTHDSPPDQELVTVRLLEDFYCCETGEEFETQRYLFRPDRE